MEFRASCLPLQPGDGSQRFQTNQSVEHSSFAEQSCTVRSQERNTQDDLRLSADFPTGTRESAFAAVPDYPPFCRARGIPQHSSVPGKSLAAGHPCCSPFAAPCSQEATAGLLFPSGANQSAASSSENAAGRPSPSALEPVILPGLSFACVQSASARGAFPAFSPVPLGPLFRALDRSSSSVDAQSSQPAPPGIAHRPVETDGGAPRKRSGGVLSTAPVTMPPPASVTAAAPAESANGAVPATASASAGGPMRSQLRADAVEFRPAASAAAVPANFKGVGGQASLPGSAPLGLVHHPGAAGSPSPASPSNAGLSVNNGASPTSPSSCTYSTHQFNRNAQEFVPGRPFMVFPSPSPPPAGTPPPPAMAAPLASAQGAASLSRAAASPPAAAAPSAAPVAVPPVGVVRGSPAGAATLPAYGPQVVGRGAPAAHLPGGGAHHSQPFIPVPGTLHFAPMHPVPSQFASPIPNGALFAGQPPSGAVEHLVVAPVGSPTDPTLAQLDKAVGAGAVPGPFVFPYAAPHAHLGPPPGANCAAPGGEFLVTPYAMGGPAPGTGSGVGRGRGGRLGRGGRAGDVNYRVSGGVGRGAGRGIPNAPGASRMAQGAPHHGRGNANSVPAVQTPGAGQGGQGGAPGRVSAGTGSDGADAKASDEVKSPPPPPPTVSQGSGAVRPPAGTSFRDKLLQGNAKADQTEGAGAQASAAQAGGKASAAGQERTSPASSLTTTGPGSGTGTAVGGGASPTGSSTNDGARSPVSSGAGPVSSGEAKRPATAPATGLSYAGAVAAAALSHGGNGAAHQGSPRAGASGAGGSRAPSASQKGPEETPKQGKASPETAGNATTSASAATPSWSQKVGSAAATPAKESSGSPAAGLSAAAKDSAGNQTRRGSLVGSASPSRRGSARSAPSAPHAQDRVAEAPRPRAEASADAPASSRQEGGAEQAQAAVEKASPGEATPAAPQGPRSWAERMKNASKLPVAVVAPSPSARKSAANVSAAPNAGGNAAARGGASAAGSPAAAKSGPSGAGGGVGKGDVQPAPEAAEQHGASQGPQAGVHEKKREVGSAEGPTGSAAASGQSTGWAARVSAPSSPKPAAGAGEKAGDSHDAGREGGAEAASGAAGAQGSRAQDGAKPKQEDKSDAVPAGAAGASATGEFSQVQAEVSASAATSSGPMTWAERARRVKEKPVPAVEPAKPSPSSEAVSESRAPGGKFGDSKRGERERGRGREEGRGHGYVDRAGHPRRDQQRGSRGEAADDAAAAAAAAHEGGAHRQGRGGSGSEALASGEGQAPAHGAAGAGAQEGPSRRRGSHTAGPTASAAPGEPRGTETGAQKPSGCYAAVVAAAQPQQPRRWGPQATQQAHAESGGRPSLQAAAEDLTPSPGEKSAWRAQAGGAVGAGASGAEGQGAAGREVLTKAEEPHVLWPRNRPKLKKVVVEQEEEKEAPLLPGQEQKFALPQGRKDQLRAEERRRAKQQVLKQEAEEIDDVESHSHPSNAETQAVSSKTAAAPGALGVSGSFMPSSPAAIPPTTGAAPVAVTARGFPTTASLVGSVFSTPTTLETTEPPAVPALSPRSPVSLVTCVSSTDVQKPSVSAPVEQPPFGFAASLAAKKEAAAESVAPRIVAAKVGGLPPVSAGFSEPPPSEDALCEQAMKAEMGKKLSPRGRASAEASPRSASRAKCEAEARKASSPRAGCADRGQTRRLSGSSTHEKKDGAEAESKRETFLSPRAAAGQASSPRSRRRPHSPAYSPSGSASPRAASPQANRLLLPEGAVEPPREGQRSRAGSAHSPRSPRRRGAAPAAAPAEASDSPVGSSGSASSPSEFVGSPATALSRSPDAGVSSPQSKSSFSPPSAASLVSDGIASSVSGNDVAREDGVSSLSPGGTYSGPYSKRLLVACRLSKQAASVPALISISALSHAAIQQAQPGGDFWYHGRQAHDDSWKSRSGRAGGDGLLHSLHRKNDGKRGAMGQQGASGRNEDGWRMGDGTQHNGSRGQAGDSGRSAPMRDWRRGEESGRGGLSAMAGGLGGFFNQERPDPGEFRRMQQSLPPPPSHAILKASESSWVKKQAEQKKDEQQQLLRRLKGHLNKLTLEKFEKLYPQILNAGIKEKEEVNALMKMVFEKAVSQHHFIQMYVQLCSRLKDDLKQILADDAKGSYFRRILINQCEDSFVANLEPMRVPEGLGEEEAFEFAQLYKARMKGNMIFVGELLKSRMISHRILLECIDRLLQKRLECIEISGGEDQGVPHMEALCAFLHTVGPFFENPKWKFYEEFCERIKIVQKLQKDESLPFRVRCLLKDVLDNRAEKWRKKFAATKEGPTRLSELHQQAQLEQMQQHQYSAGLLGGKGRGPGFDNRGDDGGWEMAPSRRGLGLAKLKPGMNSTPMNTNSRMGGEPSKPLSAFSALGRMRSEREKEREPGRDDNLRRENWGSSLSKRSPASAAASSDAAASAHAASSGPSSLLGRAPVDGGASPAKESRRRSAGETAATKASSAGAAPVSEEQQVAAARSELKDLVQSMDLNTALEMLKEMNLSPSVHKEIFDEWLKYSIEALVADKDHVNKQRAIAFQLFVQVCQKGIMQAESLKACLKQFMSNGSDGDEGEDGEVVEDSPYSDLKIDVPRLTDFMKEFLQTLETADPERQVLSTSTLDDLKGKL
ncbi:GJ21226, related [Neospora caninum Liverpool]|uniref:GJ21226, related n=1 Tax=Neospora caninum (strain Liverpool) TaxID=572307 RepID=F0VJM7_NEOCL|nr:GJ21226, related [Neospora caninum Liverpool]CBZ53938.1 GJ21226, related [Neospora caninum Liverpool]CEL67936.1 TPA: GJ21226, related [Neospora caninum Liverpool]|eukprot:XP_003883970.1 GJ21226, related [Neospora caninum Liverpool]